MPPSSFPLRELAPSSHTAEFIARNGDLDLAGFDFHDRESVDALDWSGSDRGQVLGLLRTRQRLLRVAGSHGDAERLHDAGLTSAHHIARLSEARFVAEHVERFESGAEGARETHRRARAIAGQAAHVWATAWGVVASPHYRATRFFNTGEDVVSYVEGLPGYQELFGGLDYLTCPPCRSIFSPAAYFTDLMRVVDEYITWPNTHKQGNNIPDGMRLEDRRPDLFDNLQLTCANTDTVIPYLRVVNEVLQARIEADGKGSAFGRVALAPYPFNLPFNLPLAQLRAQLARLNTTLAGVFGAMDAPVAAGPAAGGTADTIVLAPSASDADGAYAGMTITLTDGAAAGERRRVSAYAGATRTATVEPAWSAAPAAGAGYEVADTLDLARERLGLSRETLALVTTPAASAEGVSRAYGYADVLKELQPYTVGTGTITTTAGSRDTTGSADAALGSLPVGTRLRTEWEERTLVAVVAADRVTVDTAWERAGTVAYAVGRWPAGAGLLTVAADDRRATGNGDAHFDTTLAVGDQIALGAAVRTVTEIRGATELYVDTPWPVAAADAAYTVNRASLLERAPVFMERTGLDHETLAELFTQQLSPREVADGVAGRLFINAGEALPPLAVVMDRTDPAAPYQRIVGLTLDRLDRVSRFVRLQRAAGLTATELDWVMRTAGGGAISPAAIEALQAAKSLASATGLPVDAVTAFWHDVKTMGEVRSRDRLDPFDRTFNAPGLLRGADPYDASKPAIPFDPARPLDWDVDERAPAPSQNATIRSRLAAALAVSDDDLTRLARYVLRLTGAAGSVLPLTLANLSWLYRLARQAAWLQLTLRDFLTLLRLRYHPASAEPPQGAFTASIATAREVERLGAWLAAAPFDVYQLLYVVTGEVTPFYDPGFTEHDLRTLVGEMATGAQGTRVTDASLVVGSLLADPAAELRKRLVTAGLLTGLGLVPAVALSYGTVAPLLPVGDLAFASQLIGPDESRQAFAALVAKGIVLAAGGAAEGTLAESFTASTPLDFLFPSDPDAAAKRQEVQRILLQVRANVTAVLQVLADARDAQEGNARQGVAGFLGITTDLLMAAVGFALHADDLAAYRVALLTPLAVGDPVPAPVTELLSRAARTTAWALPLRFTAVEIAGVRANPAPFGIADTRALTLAGVTSLSAFRAQVRAFGDTDGRLLAWFAAPAGERAALLARITGWDAAQIAALAARFFPAGALPAGREATVAGVARMAAAFDLSATTGLDVYALAGIAALLPVSLGAIGGTVDEAAWGRYEVQVGRTLDALGALYGPAELAGVLEEITDGVDTLKRDALLGYAIWDMSRDFRFLRTPADLYQFLLLDVEMSGCARTSRIAQGIASVQLYLQRCRMNLEAGVTDAGIEPEWWPWLSSYRMWEANRKIFLYPESYVDPTRRGGATPLFRALQDGLMQTDVTDASVRHEFLRYFDGLTVLADLTVTGTYSVRAGEAAVVGNGSAAMDGGAEAGAQDALYVVARTHTQPYTYHYRVRDEYGLWGAWLKIDLSINSAWVTPVVAFGKLFLFWTELETTQNAQVTANDTQNRFVVGATTKYSFLDVGNQWVQPQVLVQKAPVEVGPSDYPPASKDEVKALFHPDSLDWKQVYPLRIARGMVGTGRVTVTSGLPNVSGAGTQFKREVRAGDAIFCAGETRVVGRVFDDQLVVDRPWTVGAKNAQYKVIPPDPDRNAFPPFAGSGLVSIQDGLANVAGNADTDFIVQVDVGARMICNGEVRTVTRVSSAHELVVHKPWSSAASAAPYTIVPGDAGSEQLVVLHGGALDVATTVPADRPPHPENPGRDPFIAAREEFDDTLFDSLKLAADTQRRKIAGAVPLGVTRNLNVDLNQRPRQVVLADYQFSADGNPRPFRALVERSEQVLRVSQSTDVLLDNFWTNSAPGAVNPLPPVGAAAAVDVLYNVASSHASLLNVGNQPGTFVFDNGDESFIVETRDGAGKPLPLGKLADLVFTNRIPGSDPDRPTLILSTAAYTTAPPDFGALRYAFTRASTAAVGVLARKIFTGGIDHLLTVESQETPELPFDRFYPVPGSAPPAHVIPPRTDLLDFDGAYGVYFQEVFLFAPWLIASRLGTNQRFEEAQRWLQYVFDPTAPPSALDEHPNDRFWRYLPFRGMTLRTLAQALNDPRQIRRYNDQPFDPDAIAALRPGAYAKAVVLAYIGNLLSWGDSLFAQDTSESVNAATQIYVMAAELLGPRPQALGECPLPAPTTFRAIREKYGQDIPQFLISVENSALLAPAAAQELPAAAGVPINDVPGAYFCVPDNAELVRYWDLVEDRLFKIRHCMNISGVVRQLALFEPPLDPREVARQAAAGRGGAPVGAGGTVPIPAYRFTVMLERARSMAGTVSQLGSALLGALSQRDAESLALLQSTQQASILNLTTLLKQQQIQEVQATGLSLSASLQSATARQEHYDDLLRTGLSAEERANLNLLAAAMVFNVLAGVTTTASSIGYAVPQVGSPFAMTYGGQQIGSMLQAAAGVFQIGSTVSTFLAQQSLTMAGYSRRAEDWTIQSRLAGYDVRQITAQIASNDARLVAARRDLEIHLQAIEQNRTTEGFLRGKFTNAQLYEWMAGRLSTLYFQSYLIALDLARAAERALQFETGAAGGYLDPGAWDSLRRGLLAGESLALSLNQMEKGYADGDARRLEITRTVSLLQLDPSALLQLQATGECTFVLPERLYDQDYPGHYNRRLKTVSVSIPAVFGPYQNVKATLTQLTSQVVLQPNLDAVRFLLGITPDVPSADVLRSNWRVNQQVALSSGAGDSGLFELSFSDPRYLPFEGTGAVSTWRLRMPRAANRIDFSAIGDVLVEVRYQASDGGADFAARVAALDPVREYAATPLVNFAQQYPTEWFAFLHEHADPKAQTLSFALSPGLVPPQVEKVRVRGFRFQLLQGAGDGARTGGRQAAAPYIALQLTDTDTVEFALDARDGYSRELDAPIALDKLLAGVRRLTFKLPETPARLKDADGWLDPAVVRNIGLILHCEGVLAWS